MRLTRAAVYPIVLLAAVFSAYSNVFNFAFLYDDEFLIQKNRFLDSFSHLADIFTHSSTGGAAFVDSFYRPMQGLAYLFVNQIFGREEWAFHTLNLVLHAVNILLVYLLGVRLSLSQRAAFLAALLWGLHPLHVEAVTYMSATADPMHAAFVLGALCLMAPEFSPRRVVGALALYVLGMLSKESAIVLPGLIIATLYLLSSRRHNLRTYLVTWPFWLAGLVYFALRRTVLNFNQDFSFYKHTDIYAENPIFRFWTFLATLPSYLELLLWPHDLHMDRNFPVFAGPWAAPVILGAVMSILAIALVIGGLRNGSSRPYALAGFSVLWFAAAHAPHSGVFMAVNSRFLEHWMYLSSVALFLFAGDALDRGLSSRLPSVRLSALALAVVAALGLAQKTYRQNWIWASPVSLYSHILKYDPTVARVRHNLAMTFSDQGREDEALQQYEEMIRAKTGYHQTYHNAARIYFSRNQLDRAEAYYLKALELSPNFANSLKEIALLYRAKGDLARSAEYEGRLARVLAK